MLPVVQAAVVDSEVEPEAEAGAVAVVAKLAAPPDTEFVDNYPLVVDSHSVEVVVTAVVGSIVDNFQRSLAAVWCPCTLKYQTKSTLNYTAGGQSKHTKFYNLKTKRTRGVQ